MEQIALAIYALSTFSQMAALGLFAFLYLSGRSPLLRAYLFYLGVNLFQVLSALLGLYAFGVLGPGRAVALMPWFRFPALIALAGLTVSAPAFFITLADSPYPPRMRRLFRSLAIAGILIAPLSFLPAATGVVPYLPSMLALASFLVAMGYGQVKLIRAYPQVQERLLKISVPGIIVYNAVCILGGTADSLASGAQIAAGSYPWGILFMPVVSIFWSALSFAWALRFHDRLALPGGSPQGLEPHEGRIAEYGITEREREVLAILSTGLSNKEIAAKFDLSQHTVRNHLHSMFEKTGSKSRVELLRRLST